MLVIKQHRIYRQDIKANPHTLYLFGDNLDRVGFGGQAKEMRGEPNSFGIATKRKASHNYHEDYFHDSEEDVREIIDEEFSKLHKEVTKTIYTPNQFFLYMKVYTSIVIPLDGIGTGLSKLPQYAPKLLEYINIKLKELESL